MKVKVKAFDTQEHLDNVDLWNELNKEKNLQFNYPHLHNRSVVFDCGGYVGGWAEKILQTYDCYVHSFEPLPEFFQQAKERLKSYSNFELHEFALGNSNRVDLISYFKDGSTFFIESDQEIKVPVRDVIEVMDELPYTHIDLMKLNVEGSEYEILERLIQEDRFESIATYQIQFHREIDNHKEKRLSIQETLKEAGYKCDYNVEWVWESWSKV